MDELPEADYLVAGSVETGMPWKKIFAGALVGLAAGYVIFGMNKDKKAAPRTRKRRTSSSRRR
jgi:uncharacterized membrane-anchored protein YhcB (DUF1043 family)